MLTCVGDEFGRVSLSMNWPERTPEWEELGLGPDELKLYAALLASPRLSSLSALTRTTDLPPDRVETALGTLTDQGFARPAKHGDALPDAVPPATALRNVIQRRQAELLSRSARLKMLSASVDRLAARLPGDAPGERDAGIETVRGREAIAERVQALMASASSELMLLDRPPYASSAPGGMPAPLAMGDLVARGVTVRAVVDRGGLDFPGRARGLNALASEGVHIRVAADLPTKLIAVDGRVSLLPPTNTADPTASALIVRDSLLHNALVPLFEALWERAMPIGPGTQEDVTAEDRELLTLLASGLKDEAIARRVDVHVHTVRRRIKRLQRLLDAETRFQTGVQALRRGWLTR